MGVAAQRKEELGRGKFNDLWADPSHRKAKVTQLVVSSSWSAQGLSTLPLAKTLLRAGSELSSSQSQLLMLTKPTDECL